jgi:hypothetical protein
MHTSSAAAYGGDDGGADAFEKSLQESRIEESVRRVNGDEHGDEQAD